MPAFFAHARGSVVRVPVTQRAPVFGISMDGISFTRAIITQCGLMLNGNFQFLHTLNDTIFLYVFGRRIGEMSVSGISFGATCPGSDNQEGITEVIQKYEENQLAVRSSPIKIALGPKMIFNTFLTGMQESVSDPETSLGQWSFRFSSFPASGVK